jgi:hypothetical protein
MRSKKPFSRRRKFKKTSSRRLAMSDLAVLDFLWTWKVASTPMLQEVAFRKKSPWWVYKALRRLRTEKYIELLPRGKNLEQELWTLTDHGFEIVLMDRDDIKEYRYRVHAPAHDYLGTCLQLGDIWSSGIDAQFYTEQMLATLAPRNFPEGFKKLEPRHVPDGVTVLAGSLKEAIIGYEVDLNLKEESRYYETWMYYRFDLKPHLIVWLVRNPWIANRIVKQLGSVDREQQQALSLVAFVLMEDFKQRIWNAEVIMGPMKGLSLRKLHANLLQNMGKDAAKIGQKDMQEIFFPRFKSPQKSFTYKKGAAAESY